MTHTGGMARSSAQAFAPATTLSLHGVDPRTGVPVTWHVTPLADDGLPGGYLLEQADGDIRSPALWMQTQREARVVGEDEVLDLVREVVLDIG